MLELRSTVFADRANCDRTSFDKIALVFSCDPMQQADASDCGRLLGEITYQASPSEVPFVNCLLLNGTFSMLTN